MSPVYNLHMLLLFHITAAFGSLAAAGLSYAGPSRQRLRATYLLTAGMLISGTVLVIQNTAHLVEACVMGLVLLGVITFASVSAQNKLARASAKNGR